MFHDSYFLEYFQVTVSDELTVSPIFSFTKVYTVLMKNIYIFLKSDIWVKVFKNRPSKICGRQPLKNLKWYGLLKLII